MPNHRRTTSSRSWKRRWSTMAFPFSSGEMMIDYLILRLGNYPQDRGTRPCGWQINTAFVERVNLSLRQRVAAIGRRSATPCKGEDGLRQQLALFHVYHNFVLPHASLRQPFLQPEPTNGTGSAKRWRPCTPARAAGLTDHTWSLKEVLLYRVPPWPEALVV